MNIVLLRRYMSKTLGDGIWAHFKNHIPKPMHTYTKEEQARIEMYANVHARRAPRENSNDLFVERGPTIGMMSRKE